jgi:hypothetical protein
MDFFGGKTAAILTHEPRKQGGPSPAWRGNGQCMGREWRTAENPFSALQHRRSFTNENLEKLRNAPVGPRRA